MIIYNIYDPNHLSSSSTKAQYWACQLLEFYWVEFEPAQYYIESSSSFVQTTCSSSSIATRHRVRAQVWRYSSLTRLNITPAILWRLKLPARKMEVGKINIIIDGKYQTAWHSNPFPPPTPKKNQKKRRQKEQQAAVLITLLMPLVAVRSWNSTGSQLKANT